MLLPVVALFTFFITVPAIEGVFYSFTHYVGYGAWHFVGLTNYRAIASDPNIRHSYVFTLYFAFTTTIVVNVISLGIALALSSKIKWKTGFRAIFFLPMVISGLVISYVFQYLFSTSIPAVVGFGPLHQGILTDSHTAWLGIVFVTAWQACPGTIIIYIAGIASIGTEVYEASAIDGATSWRSFRHITLPLLFPFVIINTVLGLKGFLGAYDVIVGLTGGGPGTSTQSVAMSIISGFSGGDYAYQMANAFIFFLVTLLLSIIQLTVLRRRGDA